MLSKLQKDQKGFTIIEVLIVLAIAGLIMLIVFLAIPALQRNQRNNSRNSEASRAQTLVTECLANRNGQTGSCDAAGEINYVTTDFTQFTNAPAFATGGTTPPTSSTTQLGVWFGRTCATDGASSVSSTNTRSFVVLYTLEPAVTRCITG